MKKSWLLAIGLSSLAIFSTFSTWGSTPYVSSTDTLTDGSNEMVFESSLFQTTNRVTPDKVFNPLENGESFQSIDFSLGGSYGFTSNLQGNLGINYRSNISSHFIGSDLEKVQTTGPESAWVGFRYNWPRIEQMQYAIIGQYNQRLFTNEIYTVGTNISKLALADDGPNALFGLGLSYFTTSQNFFSGELLYRNPGTEISSEIVLRGEYVLLWKKFSALVGFESVTSMNQDAFSEDFENKPLVANGATAMYNSVNRSWLQGSLGLGFSIGKQWRIQFKAANVLNGVSTDLGTRYTITFARRTSSTNSFEEKDQSFKEYSVDAIVTKISKKGSGVVINKGISSGVEKNMKVDFYHFDYLGGNQLIASGFVIKATASKSVVKITRRFSKRPVKEGTIARGGLIRN